MILILRRLKHLKNVEELPLTDRQQETYNFIVNYIKVHGYAPSIREISRGISYCGASRTYIGRQGFRIWR